LGDGTYFFAVLSPGGQPAPNDGGTNTSNGELANLSDNSDVWTNREFSVSGSIINYGGTHDVDTTNNEIQLFPYADTPNSGGVYILAVCKVPANPTGTPGVNPKDCKYDAFKVVSGTGCSADCGANTADDLTASKTAAPVFTRAFTWSITKSACAHGVTLCKQTVNAAGGNVTFDYTVKVKESAGVDSGWEVEGAITVENPNLGSASNVVVGDSIDNFGSCHVSSDTNFGLDPTGGTLPGVSEASYPYSCTFTSNPVSGTNTANVTWDQTLSDGSATPDGAPANPVTADYAFGAPTTVTGSCITVTDAFNGATPPGDTLGMFCGDSTSTPNGGTPAVTAVWTPLTSTWTLTYSRAVSVVADACTSYGNTATFTGASVTSNLDGTGTANVTVCGPVVGGLTMGFWQNQNGQKIINGGNPTGTCTGLFNYLTLLNPFKDLTSSICGTSPGYTSKNSTTPTGIAGYVYNVIKGGGTSCGGANCNALLKAQMLATALDVYFSDTGLGGNLINAVNPLGAVKVNTASWVPAFGSSCESVSQMLTDASNAAAAASASNPLASQWYGQVKATQVLAKTGFDSINNQVAFICS
jgi:hypothetical protein